MAVYRRTSRDIRSESRLVIMRALLAAGESTRNRLVEDTGLSLGTVLGVGILLPGGMQRPVKAPVALPNAIWLHLDRLRDRLGMPLVTTKMLPAI